MKYVKLFENWLNEAETKKLPQQNLPDTSELEKILKVNLEKAKEFGIEFGKKNDDSKSKETADNLAKGIIKFIYPKYEEYSKNNSEKMKQQDEIEGAIKAMNTSQLFSNLSFSLFGIIEAWYENQRQIENALELGKKEKADELEKNLSGGQATFLKHFEDVLINNYTKDQGKQLLADAYNKNTPVIPNNIADFIGGTKPMEIVPPKFDTAPLIGR